MIKASAPGKIHLLGEHAVVYGKPALLSAISLRVTTIISPSRHSVHKNEKFKKIIEPIIKNRFKLKKIPDYHLEIDSQIPLGAGLGSSAALSASYIAALLAFLGYKLDIDLINELTFEAEKVFHGNPSGGDNTAVVYGGLIRFQKGKSVKPLKLKIPTQLSKNIVLINTGKPKESTKKMVQDVKDLYKKDPELIEKFLKDQELLTNELLKALKNEDTDEFIRIIKAGEVNLEKIGVVSPYVATLIRKIENSGGVAKICGGGGKTKATGIVLAYHPKKEVLEKIAYGENLPFLKVSLGSDGVKID